MSAENICDLGTLADQAAEPVPAQNAHAGHFRWRMRQYRVERVGELPGPVPDQEPEPSGGLSQVD